MSKVRNTYERRLKTEHFCFEGHGRRSPGLGVGAEVWSEEE